MSCFIVIIFIIAVSVSVCVWTCVNVKKKNNCWRYRDGRRRQLSKDAALHFWSFSTLMTPRSCVWLWVCYVSLPVCLSLSFCLSGGLLCQPGDGVRNSSTDLGIKLMCWDQGASTSQAVSLAEGSNRSGEWVSERALAFVMAQGTNTCLRPALGGVKAYISLGPTSLWVVIIVIHSGCRWWDYCLSALWGEWWFRGQWLEAAVITITQWLLLSSARC